MKNLGVKANISLSPLDDKFFKKQDGFLTAEFLFSFVIATSLIIILFSITYTLSMSEVAQYIAFATSRSYIASHQDQDQQRQVALQKYRELRSLPPLQSTFGNSDSHWFDLSATPDIRGGGPEGRLFEDYPASNSPGGRVTQTGVVINFSAKLLGSLKLPLIGALADPEQDGLYQAKVTAFLIREPTYKECWELHIKPRYTKILELEGGRFKELAGKYQDKYIPLGDNGC